MAKKPEAKPKPQKKMTDKEQSERFIQAARELDADESGKDFELAAARILKPAAKPDHS
jgi:hypothetical protein